MKAILNLLNGDWIDPITRLPNKQFAEEVLKNLKESGQECIVIHVKVDVENLSKEELDFTMSRVASVIKHSVRIPKDFVCRIDDGNFCIVIHGVDDDTAHKVAERIKDSLEYLLLSYAGKKIKLNCTISIEKIGGGAQ